MQELDFLVGGIPRSGTTAFADALNRHPDLFCYASETNLLPLAQQIGCSGPIPPAAIPQVREWLRQELRQSLIDMVNFNIAMGSPEPTVRFNESEIDRLVTEILRIFATPDLGISLTDVVSAELARELRRKSGKKFVGEKTPSNVLALDTAYLSNPMPADYTRLFLVVRRSLSVIRSMRGRLSNEKDKFTSAFVGDTAQQAGFYLKFALACARLARKGAQLLHYEVFSTNAREVLPGVLSAIGVPVNSSFVEAIDGQIENRSRKDDRDSFSEADQATIDALTEGALALLGYARNPRSRASEAVFELGFRVLAGEHHDKMLDRRAIVSLVAEPHHRKATFRFWHCFPGTVADGSDLVCWTVLDIEGRKAGSVTSRGGGPATVHLSVDLDPARATRCANGRVLYVLEACCSHAFVPLVHRFRLQPASPDRREVSGKLLSVSFA